MLSLEEQITLTLFHGSTEKNGEHTQLLKPVYSKIPTEPIVAERLNSHKTVFVSDHRGHITQETQKLIHMHS